MFDHFNCHRPTRAIKRPCKSLETKWGTIKHDMAKVVGVYGLGIEQEWDYAWGSIIEGASIV
jgi:hypothetical protein